MLKLGLIKSGFITGTGLLLAGCAAPIIGGLTVSQVMTAATVGSYLATGKGTGELALSIATGKDCRVLEGALRKDREICEDPQSPATAGDFKGLPTIVAALETDAGTEGAPVLVAGIAGDEVVPEFTDIHREAPVWEERDVLRTASLATVSDEIAANSLLPAGNDVRPLAGRVVSDVPTVSTGSLMAPSAARAPEHDDHAAVRVVWKPVMRPFAYRILPRPAEAPRSAIFARGGALTPKRRPAAG